LAGVDKGLAGARDPDAGRLFRIMRLGLLFAHHLFGKPVPTFPDDAPWFIVCASSFRKTGAHFSG
jgi:hypothetical protein